MKSDNIKKLISILQNESEWISGTKLSQLIHVDKKTIRNYIQELNNSNQYKIESSPKGYRLDIAYNDTYITQTQERTKLILYRLLSNKDGISIFDLAEEFCVSESTISNDITNQIKSMIEPYHLDVVSHDYKFCLFGKESDIRKLIGYIATHNSNGYFSSTETLQKLAPTINVKEIGAKLKEFCDNSNLTVNSYALNNLLIHLIIIIIRLTSNDTLIEIRGNSISNQIESNNEKDKILLFANQISDYCFTLTNSKMTQADYNQIVLLISLSVENVGITQIDLDKFSQIADKDFFNATIKNLIRVAEKYNLQNFDNEFICQFYLHTYNLTQRSRFNISYPNPLALQIKQEYAPVYDMAVYYAHLIATQYNIVISEDEIGFIAFHIGSYLESHQPKSEKISCLVICEDYHLSAKRLMHELHMSFGEELTIIKMITISEYNKSYNPDIIISTSVYDFNHPHTVYVNPLITKKNILSIHSEIEEIKIEKKHAESLNTLVQIFKKELYFENIECKSSEECIKFLCKKAKLFGFVDDDFTNDVLSREQYSSTAFTNQVAIPHSINISAKNSFISIIHNQTPIPWGKKNINFVLLIGIAKEETALFRDLFDIIVDSFSTVEKTVALLQTNSFDDFIHVLTKKN